MIEDNKIYVINKEKDYIRGYGSEYSDDKIVLDDYYFSGLYDGLKEDAIWYKIKSQMNIPKNAFVNMSVYCSNEKSFAYKDRNIDIIDIIKSGMSLDEKKTILENFLVLSEEYRDNMLLTSVKGRYIFFLIEASSVGRIKPVISDIVLKFDGTSWTKLLPEFYQTSDNGFLERFLYVFQEIYEDMEDKIDNSVRNYSAECESFEFLKWLSSWYGITNKNIWTKDQLRFIMQNAKSIFSGLGTKEVLKKLCEIYLGEEIEIIEYYDEKDKINNCGFSNQEIFINPYTFTIIIKPRVFEQGEYEMLVNLIDSIKPANMEANILCANRTERKGIVLGEETSDTEMVLML